MKDPDLHEDYFILKNKLNIDNQKDLTKAENDFAIVRIKELLGEDYFEKNIDYLKHINFTLLQDVYYIAGEYRKIHVEKNEEILGGLSVEYAEPEDIKPNLDKIFEHINNTNFEELSKEEKVSFLTNMVVDIWKTHPFREGNTRTTLIFLRKYLKSYGLTYDPELFNNFGTYDYTRKALVAASFEAEDLNVERNYKYIGKLINNIVEDALSKKLNR